MLMGARTYLPALGAVTATDPCDHPWWTHGCRRKSGIGGSVGVGFLTLAIGGARGLPRERVHPWL